MTKFDKIADSERETSISLFTGQVFVHSVALVGARFDAPVANILEISGGRCGTYDRMTFLLSGYSRDSLMNSRFNRCHRRLSFLNFCFSFLFLKSSSFVSEVFLFFFLKPVRYFHLRARVVQESHPSVACLISAYNHSCVFFAALIINFILYM